MASLKLCAQPHGALVQLSPIVGDTVDAKENTTYRIFPFYFSTLFRKAYFVKTTDSTITLVAFLGDSVAYRQVSPSHFRWMKAIAEKDMSVLSPPEQFAGLSSGTPGRRAAILPVPTVGIGIGVSMAAKVIEFAQTPLISFGASPPRPVKIRSSPVYCADFYLPVNGKLCIGGAFAFQTVNMTYSARTGAMADHTDKHARMNLGIRLLYDLPQNELVSILLGMRIGYTIWNLSSDSPDPLYIAKNKMPDMPSLQFFCGWRIGARPIAVRIELGLGTAPYLAQIQLVHRFRQ